jgi:ubiquinone/menaquinone biosynthesis C-methylase UbiE
MKRKKSYIAVTFLAKLFWNREFIVSTDAPYPEIKKSHTMAHVGRPWRDYKPPPSGPVWDVITAGNTYWMLVAAIDLGVFDAFDQQENQAVETLASRLNVSALHLRHLLDCMVTLGFLDQIADLYELTETAERYLCRDGPASMASLVRVSPGPLENWINLASTIRDGKVGAPIEDDIAGTYGPLVLATYPTQHRVATRLGYRLGWQRKPSLRILDLGAGCAPWSIAAMEQSPNSSAVINDFPEIIGLAQARVEKCGLLARSAFRPGNFHDILLESEGYDLVVLGHICRTEGPDLTQKLIGRAVNALKPGGQLVVADYFSDNDRKMNAFGVQMGMTMLANTLRGGTITHQQMHAWLSNQALEMIRVIEPIGFNMVYVGTKINS